MKKVILAITLFIGFVSATVAADKNSDRNLLNELKAALKHSYSVEWTSNNAYSRASFIFNGLRVSAYYGDDGKLIGFFIHQTSSPKEISNAIQNSYNDWTVTETQMFVGPYGNIAYFALVKKFNQGLVIKATPAGKLSVVAKMK